MLFGYCRTSLKNGREQRQVKTLIDYGVDPENIYIDKISGAKRDRPALTDLKKILREGDTVVVSEIARLARKTYLTFELIEYFKSKGVRFVSVREGLDTADKCSIIVLAVLASLAETEREEINLRCQQGREIAKAEGRMGRPKADNNQVEKALTMFESGDYSVREISEATGLSNATIYRKANERGIKRQVNKG